MSKLLGSRFLIVLIIVVVALVILYLVNPVGQQTSVINPAGYEEGTELTLHKTLPLELPEGLLLEKVTPDYAGVLKNPDGTTQVKVSYLSNQGISPLLDLYKFSLLEQDWALRSEMPSERVANLSASRGEEFLIMTFIQSEQIEDGSVVTVQYKK